MKIILITIFLLLISLSCNKINNIGLNKDIYNNNYKILNSYSFDHFKIFILVKIGLQHTNYTEVENTHIVAIDESNNLLDQVNFEINFAPFSPVYTMNDKYFVTVIGTTLVLFDNKLKFRTKENVYSALIYFKNSKLYNEDGPPGIPGMILDPVSLEPLSYYSGASELIDYTKLRTNEDEIFISKPTKDEKINEILKYENILNLKYVGSDFK